jgi:hypothetical protein
MSEKKRVQSDEAVHYDAGWLKEENDAAYAPKKKAALERWAAHIEGLVSGQKARVIALRA